MSDLREQLHAEKDRHLAATYPGDLVLDVMGAPQARVMEYAGPQAKRPISIFKLLAGFGTLAAAAVIAVVIWVGRTNVTTIKTIVIQPNAPEDETAFVLNTTESMPENLTIAPRDIDNVIPDYQAVTVPSVPSFSNLSMDGSRDDSTTTSQEST